MVDNTTSKQLLQSLKATQVEWRYETTKQKADRRRFEAIHEGLFSSRPGKAAQPQGDLSTRWVAATPWRGCLRSNGTQPRQLRP